MTIAGTSSAEESYLNQPPIIFIDDVCQGISHITAAVSISNEHAVARRRQEIPEAGVLHQASGPFSIPTQNKKRASWADHYKVTLGELWLLLV